MNDQHQSRAVHLQSSAIVVAAFITTIGAITAALIQSGWGAKSPQTTASISPNIAEISPHDLGAFHQPVVRKSLGPVTTAESALARPTFSPQAVHQTALMPVRLEPPAVKGPATFVGTIQPASEGMQLALPPANLLPQSPSGNNRSTDIITTGANMQIPAATPPSIPSAAQITSSAANTPATLTVAPLPKTYVSPWYYLGEQAAPDKHSEAAKATSKSWNWNSVARFFQGHN